MDCRVNPSVRKKKGGRKRDREVPSSRTVYLNLGVVELVWCPVNSRYPYGIDYLQARYPSLKPHSLEVKSGFVLPEAIVHSNSIAAVKIRSEKIAV